MTNRQPGTEAQIPAIALAIRRWNHLTRRESAASAEATPSRQGGQDRRRVDTAAERALLRYPGPVGRLVHDEIRAYQQQTGRWPDTTLAARIIDELQDLAAGS